MKTKILWSTMIASIVLIFTQLVSCSLNPEEDNELWKAKGKNGQWGFVNKNGFFVLRPVYDEVENFSCGFAAVRLYGKLMFIDTHGRMQKLPSDVCDVEFGGFVNNYAVVQSNKKLFGVLDSHFNYVVQPLYYELGGEHGVAKNGLTAFRYSKEGKIGYINVLSGQVVIQPMFDYEIAGFVQNHAVVELNGKSGVINTNGEFVLPPIYDWIGIFSANRFAYYENNLFGLMDSTGNKITDAIFSRIIYETPEFSFSGSHLIPVENDSSKYGYINWDGQNVIPFVYDFALPFVGNHAVVYEQGKELVIDTLGNIIYGSDQWKNAEDYFRDQFLFDPSFYSPNR